MRNGSIRVNVLRMLAIGVAIALLPAPGITFAQGLTGALMRTVTDAQGGVLSGAVVRISSPALIGGELTTKTDERGQLRFPSVPPGSYALDIVLEGFRPFREADIYIGAGATIERTPAPALAAWRIRLSCTDPARASTPGTPLRHPVRRRGPRRDPDETFQLSGLGQDGRRASRQRHPQAAASSFPPSVPASIRISISSMARASPRQATAYRGPILASTSSRSCRSSPWGRRSSYGNVQGAVVNVITKSGGDRFQYDAAYYWQTGGLTSQPVVLESDRSRHLDSGYERAEYRDFTTSAGGPVVRERLWFFSGYQHLRDSDSQPATDPGLPREYEQDKFFAKLTWRLAAGWQLGQSIHHELWSNPETPSATKPRSATQRLDASTPAINFSHLIHTASPNTVWDVRAGWFRFTQDTSPTSGDLTIPFRLEQPDNIWSGGPQQIGQVRQNRATVKATLSHYRAAWFGGDHEWQMGGQVDRGEHRAVSILPTGRSFVYRNGVATQTTEQAPNNSGGRFVTAAFFVSDAIRLGGRRHDQSRAAVRSQPRHQPGRAGVRRAGARHRKDHRRPGHGQFLEHRVAPSRRGHQARHHGPDDAASQCRQIQPGSVDR